MQKTIAAFLLSLFLAGCQGPQEPPPTSIQPLDQAKVTAAQVNLAHDPELAGCGLKCSAENDMLAIHGTVPTEGAKKRAEQMALKVEGIKKIANHIMVVPQAGASPEGLVP